MEKFWICLDCGSPNPYPDSQECGVCGKVISQQEISAAEANYRTALKNEEKEKEEQRKEELRRQKEEAALRRKAEIEADLERFRREQIKKEQLKAEKRKKMLLSVKKTSTSINAFCQRLYKILRGFKKFLNVAVVACVFVVLVSVVVNGTAESIFYTIENTLETKAEIIVQKHFEPFMPFENISDRIEVFINHFENSENIKSLFEMLGW